nr:hypothetical protein [Mimivirus sp.]
MHFSIKIIVSQMLLNVKLYSYYLIYNCLKNNDMRHMDTINNFYATMIINWYRVTIIIMHYIMLSISSKDGYILEYQPDQLKNNPQVIGTLFDKVFLVIFHHVII